MQQSDANFIFRTSDWWGLVDILGSPFHRNLECFDKGIQTWRLLGSISCIKTSQRLSRLVASDAIRVHVSCSFQKPVATDAILDVCFPSASFTFHSKLVPIIVDGAVPALIRIRKNLRYINAAREFCSPVVWPCAWNALLWEACRGLCTGPPRRAVSFEALIVVCALWLQRVIMNHASLRNSYTSY